MKNLIFLFSLLFIVAQACAQHPNAGLILGASAGMAKVSTELTPGFKTVPNEFNHKFAPAVSLELSKLLGNHFEIGTDVNLTLLKGDTDNPQFSAEGIHGAMKDPIAEPVEYNNQLFGQQLFVSYYFRTFEAYSPGYRLEPFVRTGIGYQAYTAGFKYIDAPDDELIFGKNKGNYKKYELFEAVYFVALGVKTKFSNHFFMNTTVSFNYSNYDFLDVVHNYNSDGSFADLRGLYTAFKIGFFYQSNEIGKHKSRRGQYNKPVLPFSGK
ncbi:hypothetical protein [uncultured Draconibacterium sp.]|uniref:hypothetical protein n=1 Tax=uncultured Draconibacterium sp. TaxID=1573823 RepID=UPI0026010115|nr:hypothetical protein [uncultured Draconibacterium sp.]